LSIEVSNDLHIPLQSHGTKIKFRSRVPTTHELATCPHVQMTSASPWNPDTVHMAQVTAQGGNTCGSDKSNQ
jgi:hypothetical protein